MLWLLACFCKICCSFWVLGLAFAKLTTIPGIFHEFLVFHTLLDLLQFLLPVSRFFYHSMKCSRSCSSSSSSVTPPPPQLVPAILPASHYFPHHCSSTGFVPTHSFRISLHQEKNCQVISISTSRDELSATAATQSRWLFSSP